MSGQAALAVAGHNKPPGPIDSAKEAFTELSSFLQNNPVIQDEEAARHGAAYVERTRVALSEMENERTALVKPLNEQLSGINAAYRVVRDPLEKALKALRQRIADYANEIERKRIEEAERLRQEAEAKEAQARAAEAAEQEAIADAEVGECTDVGGAIEHANETFADYQRADRAAARAERAVPVRFHSVMGGRSISMRTTEVLKITDACAAIKAMGITPEIETALLSAARKYRKAFEELPAGITATFERSI